MNPTSRQLFPHFIKQTTTRVYVNTSFKKYFARRIAIFLSSAAYHDKKLSTTILTSHTSYSTSNIKPLNRQTRFRQISFHIGNSKNKNFNNEPSLLTKKVNRLALAILLTVACLTIYTIIQTIHSEETKRFEPSLGELETIAYLFKESLPEKNEEDSYTAWQSKCEWFCFDIVFDACINNEWHILDQIDQNLLNILTDRFGRSLLLAAAQEGNEACIKALLNKNIAISRRDLEENTPLHLATKVGRSSSIITTLCRYYANQVNAKRETALHVAVRYGQHQLISPLILNGIRENTRCYFDKQTVNALMLAVALGQIECLDALVQYTKLNLDQMNHFGNLLHIAIEYGQGKMLRHLLTKHYAQTKHLIDQPNPIEERTALSLACEKGLLEEVEFLIDEKEASYTLPDSEGRTCIHWAAIGAKNAKEEDLEKHLRTIEMLGYLGVNLEGKDGTSSSPLDYLKERRIAFDYLLSVIVQQKQGMQRPDPIVCPPQNLVFQGGGFGGIAYIGFLSALKEKGLLSEVKRVAGTSAGAITAALFAVGYTPDELKELLLDFDLTEWLDPKEDNRKLLEQVFLIAKSKEDEDSTLKLSLIIKYLFNENLKDLLHLSSRGELLRRLSKLEGLCQGEKFREWLDDKIAEKVAIITGEKKENCKYLTFGELDKFIQEGHKELKHLYVVATQIHPEFKLILFNAKDRKNVIISDAVRASMSIPGVFKPHVIHYKDKQQGRVFFNDASKCIDGGVLSHFPMTIFDSLEFQKNHVKRSGWENRQVLNPRTLGTALHIIRDREELEKDPEIKTPLDIIKAFVNIYLNLEAIPIEFNSDRMIKIPIEGVSLFDFNLSQQQKKALIRSGKQSVNEAPSLRGKIGNIANPAKREKTNLLSNQIDHHFIERNQYSEILKDKILSTSTPPSDIHVYVLYGQPGMGKTQIAVNFAARNRDDFSQIWIIDFSTERQKNQCYEEIAKKLKINWREIGAIQLREEVHKSLANQPKGEKPWLLILDNVDKPLSCEIDLPKKGGYILVTTNKKENCPCGEPLQEVGPLSTEESLTLLQKITLETPSEKMYQLAKSLQFSPLALSLSAHFIKTNRLTIKQFLTTYESKIPLIQKDEFYEYPLENVWDITLKEIEKDCPEALEWLTMCAFLDTNQISQSLVLEWVKSKSPSEADAKETALRIIKTLQKYHVFHQTHKINTYSIHEPLKQTLRNNQRETLLKNFQATFSFLKEMGKESENLNLLPLKKIKILGDWWPIQFSHLFEDSELISKISDQDKLQALTALTNYTIDHLADFRLGIRFANLGLAISLQENDLPTKAIFLSKLGQAHLALENYEEGKRYISESIKEKTQLFGENSREVAQEKHNLIKKQLDLYHDKPNQQQTEQAMNDLQKLLEIFKKENNGINSEVAECSHTIGNALFELSQLEKDPVRKKELQETSLQKYQDALTIIKQIPRSHLNLNIVQAMTPITLLINLKQYVEAEKLLIEINHLQKKITHESLETWRIKSNLGQAYLALAINAKTKEEKDKFLKKSQDTQLRALNIIKELCGENHSYTSNSLFYLGQIHEELNELNLSFICFQKSYEIRRQYFKTDQHWEIQEVLNAMIRVKNKLNLNNSQSVAF